MEEREGGWRRLRKVLGEGVMQRIRNKDMRGRGSNKPISWEMWIKYPEVVRSCRENGGRKEG